MKTLGFQEEDRDKQDDCDKEDDSDKENVRDKKDVRGKENDRETENHKSIEKLEQSSLLLSPTEDFPEKSYTTTATKID